MENDAAMSSIFTFALLIIPLHIYAGNTSIRLDSLVQIWSGLTKEAKYDSVAKSSSLYFRIFSESGELESSAAAGSYAGQSYIMLAKPDSMFVYLNKVIAMVEQGVSCKYMMYVNNTIGIYNMLYALNYNEALYYFNEAIEYCGERDMENKYTILSNIANVYYMTDNPEGLPYALDIYEWGKNNGNDPIAYRGALVAAYMHYMAGDNKTALSYVKESMGYKSYQSGMSNSDVVHGCILASLGKSEEAEYYFIKSVRDSKDIMTKIETRLNYGRFLYKSGRFEEALACLETALSDIKENRKYCFGEKGYIYLSEVYSSMGYKDKSIKCLKEYIALVSDVFYEEKEKSFLNLRLDYESERRQKELREKDIVILNQSKNMIVLTSIFLLVVLFTLYVLYRKKSKMYRNLVLRYESQMKKEQSFQVLHNNNKNDPESRKIKEIFTGIEDLMISEKLYLNSTLSLEDLATRLDTNRSYISKAINVFAGTTFNGYVNSYRIKEAVVMLSNPHNDIPIKAISSTVGYSNISSFYSNFLKETGVPPSKYRQEVLKLTKTFPE